MLPTTVPKSGADPSGRPPAIAVVVEVEVLGLLLELTLVALVLGRCLVRQFRAPQCELRLDQLRVRGGVRERIGAVVTV